MTSNQMLNKPVRRILLECTGTYFTDWNTGIQRVVRNVAQCCTAAGVEAGVECLPIVRAGDRFLALPWEPRAGRPRSAWQRWLATWLPSDDEWKQRRSLRILRRVGTRLRKLLYPRTLMRKIAHLRWSWKGILVVPGEGDTLVLLDTWWDAHAWPAVARARHRGAHVGVVVYDLLPVTHPQFFKTNITEPFTASLQIAIAQADYFIAISDTVRDQLRDYARKVADPAKLRETGFYSFRLGSTLDLVGHSGPVRDSLRRAFEHADGQQTYLTVGTVEPRKNHRYMLDAFDRIWTRHPDARFCIIGRVGWLCDELIVRVVQHAQYNKSLFMFNDASDAELEFAYQHAKGLIFASHAEGFGLPVVEALQHGLPVFASDIPIHREVGRDYCTYFDNQNPDSLASLVCEVESSQRFPAVREPDGFALPNWAESTREFVERCLQACHCEEPAGHLAKRAA